MGKVKVNAKNDQEYTVDLYTRKTDNFAERFRKQAHANENDLKVIRIQYDEVQQKYMQDLKEFESNLAVAKDKISIIESRRVTENQAFQNDIMSIKKRVINFERYIKRLKKHVDDE